MLLTAEQPLPPEGVRLVVDRSARLPELDPHDYDVMVTTLPDAPAPWVSVAPQRMDAQLARATTTAAQNPIATAILARILRAGEGLAFDYALELESLAYSVLLGGSEFANWLASRRRTSQGDQAPYPVCYQRDDDLVTLILNSPNNQNSMTAHMRDALHEALVNVLEDPSGPRLVLRANGRCFSTGGALYEFGTAKDLAAAHVIRTLRSCSRALHLIGDRSEVHLHGCCIGAGAEIPLAAARRLAAPETYFQLPELQMGLIPGAGGTVTFARAIGRHRLLWMALGGFRVGTAQALDWGLIQGLIG
ncbi:enoyl-CoA hydratase/isomerase family protein [Sphingobium sp. DEHP117]|uniref:enoyl-CoA hydratase/isomerase family protein n=1 Tax=Sphingobium sp. DEHP117 TaxID=2993436 RepID=UPI0027D5E259|nr:enoyl-CoA hydratase-related protein [Sphingobium sp. DEHP117]MDQ4421800.1 enoyl-CoA hydratase/isomerase family protein [Sphingobium sp. DEHP117]